MWPYQLSERKVDYEMKLFQIIVDGLIDEKYISILRKNMWRPPMLS